MGGINHTSAVFDEQKLQWMNGEFLTMKPDQEILTELAPLFDAYVERGEFPETSRNMLPVAVAQLKSRARFPKDILERGDFYFIDPTSLDRKAAKKRLKDEQLPEWLETLADRYQKLEPFTEETVETALRELSEELETGTGKLIHPTRLAVSGQGGGPSLFEMLVAVGQEAVVRRLRWLADFLRTNGIPPKLEQEGSN